MNCKCDKGPLSDITSKDPIFDQRTREKIFFVSSEFQKRENLSCLPCKICKKKEWIVNSSEDELESI